MLETKADLFPCRQRKQRGLRSCEKTAAVGIPTTTRARQMAEPHGMANSPAAHQPAPLCVCHNVSEWSQRKENDVGQNAWTEVQYSPAQQRAYAQVEQEKAQKAAGDAEHAPSLFLTSLSRVRKRKRPCE